MTTTKQVHHLPVVATVEQQTDLTLWFFLKLFALFMKHVRTDNPDANYWRVPIQWMIHLARQVESKLCKLSALADRLSHIHQKSKLKLVIE